MGVKPSYPQRELNRRLRLFASQRRGALATVAAIALVLMAVTTALAAMRPVPGALYALGAVHVGIVLQLIHEMRIAHLARDARAVHLLRGSRGEWLPSEALRSAQRRRIIWGWVDGVTVQSGDVDHLVVTRRGGVLAIDSKWHSTTDHVQAAAESAAASSRRATSVLRSLGFLDRDTSARHRSDSASILVRPAVVVWGSAQPDIPRGARLRDVHFVRGDEFSSWLRELDGEPIGRRQARALLHSIRDFTKKVDPTDAPLSSADRPT